MSTGDLILTCELCYETYYLSNGHNCIVAQRKYAWASYTDNISGPVLDDRVDRIERKLDELLRLMKSTGD